MWKLFSCLLVCLTVFVMNAHAAQVNRPAAVVNGQLITTFDVQRQALPDLLRARIDPATAASNPQGEAILRSALDFMIMDILIQQEAKRLKATVSASEVDNEIRQLMKARGLNRKQMEEQLAQQKLTIDGLKETISKNLLRQKVMAAEVARKVVVTAKEIEDYYEQHKDEMIDRSGLHMGVLVYSPRVNAASIAQQIKSGKLSFAEACSKYSIAPNKDAAGDTGEVEWDKLNPEWDVRLKSMRPGGVTDLFDLQGFKAQAHLFRPGGGEERTLTLEEARPQIDMILRQPKAQERFEDYTAQLKKKAVIDVRM